MDRAGYKYERLIRLSAKVLIDSEDLKMKMDSREKCCCSCGRQPDDVYRSGFLT